MSFSGKFHSHKMDANILSSDVYCHVKSRLPCLIPGMRATNQKVLHEMSNIDIVCLMPRISVFNMCETTPPPYASCTVKASFFLYFLFLYGQGGCNIFKYYVIWRRNSGMWKPTLG